MPETAANSSVLTSTVTQAPRPPSLEGIYLANKTSGLTVVFAEWDSQFKAYTDNVKRADEISAPPMPMTGGPLLTPSERATKATATAKEHRLGWAKLVVSTGNRDNDYVSRGGWPITILPPGIYPQSADVAVVQYEAESSWFTAVPGKYQVIKETRAIELIDPHFRVTLNPFPTASTNDVGYVTRIRAVVKTSSGGQSQPPIYAWQVFCSLETKAGTPVSIRSVYAELI